MSMNSLLGAVALAMAALPGIASAVTDAEIKELRDQLRQLKEQYERRIEALERRLQQAEKAAGGVTAAGPRTAAAQPSQARTTVSESALNPGVSLILNGVYASFSRDPATYRMSGFAPTGNDIEPGGRGLRLGESELAISANIDHGFRGTLIATLGSGGGAEIEEGYVQTLGLAHGLSVKAGRFFSATGYINQTHRHTWDFADAPLASRAFLGTQRSEDGLQIRWVAPTPTFLELGAEIGRGRGFPGTERDKNGTGSGVLFAHVGGDIGNSTAWQLGWSHLRTRAADRGYDDLDSTGTAVHNSFSGASRLWVVDGILKWAPQGNPRDTNFKLQGEYFRRREDGSLLYDADQGSLGSALGSMRAAQSGWYLQGVYQFFPRWRAGYRYDKLNFGKVALGLVESGAMSDADFPAFARHDPVRQTVMVDFSPSEFSRIRLQIARDRSRLGEPDNQLLLQYVMGLGAHRPHRF